MGKAKARIYNAHKDYDAPVDAELLNMKIRIYDESFQSTGKVLYEGSIGRFLKERLPSEYLVEILTGLRTRDKLSYRLSGGENYIERLK
ncbi:MAG: hypothetical protein ACM3ZR_09285 [Pseudomonadota bacterium]